MDAFNQLKLSYYKTITTINEAHGIYLVQHIENKHMYIKKILDVYNADVYESLMSGNISYIPKILELIKDDNQLIVIEEYISGSTLEELLESGYSFSNEEIQDIIIKLCDILSSLHKNTPPIIHRDIKPSNIILTAEKNVFLLDLNAAKYKSEGKDEDTTLLGTKGYAAPEQYGFGLSNPETDLYALGKLMNTLVCGAFQATTVKDSVFTPIIEKCTKLDSKERFHTAEEVKQQLVRKSVTPPKPLTRRDFLPVGFRSLNPLHMFVSTAVYAFMLWLFLGMRIKEASLAQVIVQKTFCILVFLGVIGSTFNYAGIHERFPLTRSTNRFLKLLGILFLNTLCIFTMLLLMLVVCTLIP